MPRVTVHGSAAAFGAAVAHRVATAAGRAIATRGRFRLALPGGRSPEPAYALLADGVPGVPIDWSRVHVLFVDERAVPPDDPQSNFRFVHERLLARVPVLAANVHRMHAEAADLEAAARDYEALVAEPLDLIVLGLGEDGHVASLFPGSPLLGEETRRVGIVRDSPKPPPTRMTLLPPALAAAREVLVLAIGTAKAAAVRRALEPPRAAAGAPATLLARREWHLDAAAASLLKPRA